MMMNLHPHLILLFPLVLLGSTQLEASIPSKQDGFWYKNRPAKPDSILIEAFFDPVCPDTRDAWPPLKQALKHYGSRVSLVVHPFSLPYHDNAFVSSRALHIVNGLNASATYHLLESFFEHQERFYNKATLNMSRTSIIDQIVTFTAKSTKSTRNSFISDVRAGFNDSKTDQATRVSFKYGCLRGVYGTPYFFLNGFPLPDAGSPINYDGWRNFIDPLVDEQTMEIDEVPHLM